MATTDFEDEALIEKYKKYLFVNQRFGKPAFIEFIGGVNRLNVLDLGCGTGHFCRDLTKMGAICTGVDKSNKFIEIAERFEVREKLGIKYHHLNGANLKGIKSDIFDKVVLFQVIMNVQGKAELKNIFNEVRRVLKTGGEIVFSVFHPLLLIQNYKDNLREIILPNNYSYYKNGINYRAKHLLTDFGWMEFKNTHWSMEFIFDVLKENGFMIAEIKEPVPKKDSFQSYFNDIIKVPHYMFIKATK